MVGLRADPHAQWEIQEYAKVMYELVKPKFPIICEAWEDYARDAVTFSGVEMKFIRELVIGDFATNWKDYLLDAYFEDAGENLEEAEKILCKEYGLSNRELTELKEKLGC